MANTEHEPVGETRWLNPRETEAWLALWSLMTWLPTRLDTQLRQDSGLTHPEYHALSQISLAPDRTVRLSELATVTNMTLSHLSRVVSRLEKAGWVQRTPDPDDGRYTRACLTDAGWSTVQAAAPGHVEAVRRYVFDALTPEQSRALGEAAARIVEAVNPPPARPAPDAHTPIRPAPCLPPWPRPGQPWLGTMDYSVLPARHAGHESGGEGAVMTATPDDMNPPKKESEAPPEGPPRRPSTRSPTATTTPTSSSSVQPTSDISAVDF